MSKNDEVPSIKVVRYAYEILLSLNVSFAAVSVAELKSQGVIAPFLRLELSLNRLLHIPQGDFIRGYIAFSSSSIALALFIWLGLRLLAATDIKKVIPSFLGGAIVISLPAAFWLCTYQQSGWPFGWPYRGAPFELALALLFAQMYMSGKWRFPGLLGVAVIAAHYAYWFWVPARNYFAPNYSGPIAPILGFCSAVAWAMYVKCEKAAMPDPH
jgi:hypothetical protein